MNRTAQVEPLTQHNPIPLKTLEEAMDWFLKLKARPDCPRTKADFQNWISSSPSHEQAFARVLATWELIGKVPPVHAQLWQTKTSPVEYAAPRRRKVPWTASAVLAVAACALTVLAGPSLLIRWQADHITRTAESRSIMLADGTVVDMGGGSALSADITASGRHVTLLAGEAFFDVTHDTTRPFTIDAGGVSITVLGTAFDVQVAAEATTVELARGTVAISYDGENHRQNFELSPGEMAAVDHATGSVVRGPIAQDDIAAWRTGKMFVNDVTVGAAVERLQRYHTAWISIADPSLASHRVTGLYDLNNPDLALQALVQPFGGKVRAVTAYGRILTDF